MNTSENKLLFNGSEIPIQWFEVRSDPDVFDPILTLAIDASEVETLRLLRQMKSQTFLVTLSKQKRTIELDNMRIGGLDVSVAGGRTRVLMFARTED